MSEVKRKLTNIDFSKEGAHVALVDKAANGHDVLVIKALDTEEINKAEIQVKMDVVNFLTTFFNLWSFEAATLAEIFGVDTEYFDDEFRFEEFNSIGASEVTLLKSASKVEKTEESLVDYIGTLEMEDLNTLKAFAEGFNTTLKEHRDMTDINKAAEIQVDLEKAVEEKEVIQKALDEAKEQLVEITKAKQETLKTEYLEKAKGFGAETEDLGLAMADIAASESGMTVLKALEDAHKRLDEVVEKEAGFSGKAVEGEPEETPIMKAMKNKYDNKA